MYSANDLQKISTVSWSLTSLFSTNMAISETRRFQQYQPRNHYHYHLLQEHTLEIPVSRLLSNHSSCKPISPVRTSG